MNKVIVAIGRDYGSGGKEIGEKLSGLLNIPCYDKELIELAAQESGLSQHIAQDVNETSATPSLLYTLSTGGFILGGQYSPIEAPINDRLYFAQSDIIRKYANEGSCIIVGRCADFILRERKELISVFIFAPLEKRIERISNLYDISEKQAKEKISKTDKKRRTYYRYYTDRNRGDINNYHLSIDSSLLGIDKTAELLANLVEKKR